MAEATRGQEALEKALRKQIGGVSGRAWLADPARLDVDVSAISRWCTGAGRPDPHHRRAIALLLGIPEEAWWTADEADLVRRARRIGPAQYAQAHRVSKGTRVSSGARSAGATR